MNGPHLSDEQREAIEAGRAREAAMLADPRAEREFRADDDWVDPRQAREMPFLQHLEELRSVLAWTVGACLVGAMGGWWLAPIVLKDIIARTVKTTVVMSPFEAFNERFKLSLILGLAITLPIVLWRIWGFVVPGLLKRERGWVPWLAAGSYVLFAAGASAAYWYVVPLVIHVLENFLTPGMITQIRLSSLLEFVYNMALACGVLAQLPLVTMLLTAIGLVTPATLLKQWRIAMVAVFVVTAAITPGDVLTAQLVMGLPMMVLYFTSVGLSALVQRQRARAQAKELSEEGADHV
ncbi:MAG: twin-arginine translocase subunit TatC [Candidatus Eisenbacteria bacterium]